MDIIAYLCPKLCNLRQYKVPLVPKSVNQWYKSNVIVAHINAITVCTHREDIKNYVNTLLQEHVPITSPDHGQVRLILRVAVIPVTS